MVDEAAQEQILRMLREVKCNIAQIGTLTDGANCKEALLRLSCVKLAIDQIGIYILESCAVECSHQDKRVVLGAIDDMAYDLLSLKRDS